PYTLPSAVALVLVGLYRLRMSADVPTSTALLPGLALATVPSLLWVLEDPVSIRALILGVACLALLLFGAAARWHAPVLVGAVVGGLVVVRELAPYAAQTPQWVLIGAAGAVLIGSGITWESRMRDLRNAAAYLGRLR
uniref:SCO7613 C-terminal domain-containing membrane protein n=1 Tax=Nocardioides sp. TaxID=35761 RepID=UPI0035615286